MYSLINAPVLCYDLARMPNGAAVAGSLRRALRIEASDLPTLAREYGDDAERHAAWDELEAACERRSRAAGLLPTVHQAPAARRGPVEENRNRGDLNRADLNRGDRAPADRTEAAGRLIPVTLGGLADVVSIVRSDVLEWTWQRGADLRLQTAPHAVAVVSDAVAACYAGAAISPAAFTRLRLPWTTALRHIDGARPFPEVRDEFGPGSVAVRRIAALLSSATPTEIAALDAAIDAERRGGFAWARSMHGATWAIELSGRVRAAAAAQFCAVRALPAPGDPHASALPGVVTAVTAVVQAVVVADLLDMETYDALTSAWRRVFGPLG